jgi:hypothetical protein
MALSARLQASPEVRFARLQFLLWNAEMLPIMDVMADGLAGYSFEFPSSGIIDISAVIPRTELNAGKYTLSVIAASPDYAVTYCRHDNAAYVQIDAGSTSGAQILSVAEWTSKEASMENIRA